MTTRSSSSLLASFCTLLPPLAAAALVLVPGGLARAGSCPVCTSSSECTSFEDGGVAFCVLHDNPVGCGAEVMLCCPGQGCSTASGRPSCEGDTCTVVEDLVDGGPGGTDAGPSTTDGGPGDIDAGPSTTDAGPSGSDAGGTTSDSGAGGMDAGGTTPPPSSAGCGCRVGGGASDVAGLGALGVLAALVARRRIRR